MQRIGFLKAVLVGSSTTVPQNLKSISQTFAVRITARFPCGDKSNQIQKYIEEFKLTGRYHDRFESVELQDLYLSDPQLPSRTGAITGDIGAAGYRHTVYVEMPAWATRLGLLRDHNYTLTDRGRVMQLCDDHAHEKFSKIDEANPFLLNDGEKLVSLYCLLAVDGDFLVELYRILLDKGKFTRGEAGEIAEPALSALKERTSKHSEHSLRLEQR